MNWSEFEEKEYEAPLYNQLEHGTRLVWSPGQVFEEHIGIDRAMCITDPRIWSLLCTTLPRGGMYLPNYNWDFIWRQRKSRRSLPSFKLNLFLQAKRPQYTSHRPRQLRGQLSAGTCYRISIESDQQAALATVATRARNRALVAYAGPVFYRHAQLWAHTQAGTIIENSTFPDAAKMSGHSAWWYTGSGATGHANPEWESIEDRDLLTRIKDAHSESQGDESSLENLIALDKALVSAITETTNAPTSRSAAWIEDCRAIDAHLKEYEILDTPIAPFMRIAAFAKAFNVKWYVL